MSAVVDECGELTIFVTRGSDKVLGVELRDDNDDLRPIDTLLVWIEGLVSGFTVTKVEQGSFSLLLPRAITTDMAPATAYTIGYVDESNLHQPALQGFIRVSRGRLGT